MATLPSLIDTDWFNDNKAKSKELIDYAVNTFMNQSEIRRKIIAIQDNYNKVFTDEEVKSIIKRYAKKSKTPYVMYGIGRPKIQQIIGEYLRIGIQATTYTYNPEATKEKRESLNLKRGRAIAKPIIEKMREEGVDPYDGAEIPGLDQENLFDEANFKSPNERIMQKILKSKIKDEDIKGQGRKIMQFLILNSTAFAKIERNEYGSDTIRVINPQNRIMPIFDDTEFTDELPFIGERRLMTESQVLGISGISKQEAEEIRDYFKNDGSKSDLNGMPESASLIETTEGANAAWVYTVEWKTWIDITLKEEDGYIREVSSAGNKKNAKYYQLSVPVKMIGHRLGSNIYFGINKAKNVAVITDAKGRFYPLYDYQGFILAPLNGVTHSIAEVILELEKTYDHIRYLINREMRKLHGKGVLLDEAYQSKSIANMLFDLIEEGVATMNSSSDMNISNKDGEIEKMIKSFDLGSSTVLQDLLRLGLDTERIIDSITGMNDARQGLEKATTTATANQNNLEASRSVTYELFDATDKFLNKLLTILCNKVKINDDYIENVAKGKILTSQEANYLKDTERMMFDSFGTYISNSKKEISVRNIVEMFIPQEINAGKISTADVAKYAMQESLDEALDILEKGRSRIEQLESESQQREIESRNKAVETDAALRREDREDRQSADIENIQAKGALEIQKVLLDNMLKRETEMLKEREVTSRELRKASIAAVTKKNDTKTKTTKK